MARDSKTNSVKLGVSLIFAGGWLVTSGLKRFMRTRKVEDTPTSPIASAPQGYVEIQGNAWPIANAMTKSLRGRGCVYRHLEIQMKTGSGKRSRWKTVHEERSDKPFLVFDKNGAALVRPRDAEMELSTFHCRWNEMPAEVQKALAQRVRVNGFPPSGGLFGGTFRFIEKTIAVGSPVYVKGTFSTPPDGVRVVAEPGHEAFREKIARVLSQKHLMFDHNNDGEVCAREAIEGFHSAAQVSLRHAVGSPVTPSPAVTAIACDGEMATTSNHKLYFADCAQHHLLEKIGSWNVLRIVGGAVLVGAGVIVILTEFKK